MRCVSYNPDEPTRSVMVRPGWNINRVCLCLHMRVHTCVCMCVWVDKLLCLTLGLTRVWQAYIWRRCCLREWGFRGSILYEETQGKEDFFFSFFHTRPLCWLPLWQDLALSGADVMKHSDGNEGWDGGADSHINLICPWIAACVCPDLSTARRHQPPRPVQIPGTHTHILSFSPSHTHIVKERPQLSALNILFVSFFHVLWDLIRFLSFFLFFLAFTPLFVVRINWMLVLNWSLMLTDSGNLK